MAQSLFTLKYYQHKTLDVLRSYLDSCVRIGDADTAFYTLTKRAYCAAPLLPALPYICLRVPTGGGKTLLAAHSIPIAADHYLHSDTPTVLWLVPSQTIRDQTLQSLQDRHSINRLALSQRFGDNIRIMTITDALYAGRADYDGGAVIIVATLQAFRSEEKEGRKVYEGNGALMDHFLHLPHAVADRLEKGPSGAPVPCLANVLRLRRPVIIVDEAHNARTPLSFDTLARLSPSLILEWTATPVTPQEENRQKGLYASNVLHHVSAAELKAEDMIKLPIVLRGRPDPNETISDALAWLDELSHIAHEENRTTGEFIRPIMLMQAEPRSKSVDTLHADKIKALLISDFGLPEHHIAIATGETKELDEIDLFDPHCAIRVIITQQALKEGWDCSFAYVLCSIAEQKSARAVEQILGRVLRLPRARRKQHEPLNRAYAFATTTSFQETARQLRDGLVKNGFEHVEAKELVKTIEADRLSLNEAGVAYVYEEHIPDDLDLTIFKNKIADATGGRVVVDLDHHRLQARGSLSDYDRTLLKLTLPDIAHHAIDRLVHRSRGVHVGTAPTPDDAQTLALPQLCVMEDNRLQIFDREHFLDALWPLETCPADAIMKHFIPPRLTGEEAHLDVDINQEIKISFIQDMQDQLAFALEEQGWTQTKLVLWIDRHLPLRIRIDIHSASSLSYIASVLTYLEQNHHMTLEALARAKFVLVEALIRTVADLRMEREKYAFDTAVLTQSGLQFVTSPTASLVFCEAQYGYNQPYKGATDFKKHIFPIIGDLKSSGEEHDCALAIERNPRIKRWLRNTVHKHSFFLKTPHNKFYPDFIAELDDGRLMVIEYKGGHLDQTEDAQYKKTIGTLWAERSHGQCLFVWITQNEFAAIDRAIVETGP